MKKKQLIFFIIFTIFLAFGLFLFYKSIKEIKEMEKEEGIDIPSFEKKEEIPPAPNNTLKFKDLKGKEFFLDGFKGKFVFLTFWATWCGFCARELPSIQKIYEEYKDKNIEFITLTSEEKSKVEKYINYYKYSFPVYIQTSSTPNIFKTQGIPVNFILDKEGKIVLKKEGYFDWASPEGRGILNSILK